MLHYTYIACVATFFQCFTFLTTLQNKDNGRHVICIDEISVLFKQCLSLK